MRETVSNLKNNKQADSYWILSAVFLLATDMALASHGSHAGQFLLMPAGVRAVGMGEIGAATAHDAYASFWNPAGLSQLISPYPEFVLTHNRHFESIDHQYLAWAQSIKRITPSLSVARLGVRPLEAYNSTGGKIGTVEAGDWALQASAGAAVSKNIGIGLGIKWLEEKLGPVKTSALAGDLGFVWKLPGFSFQNSQRVVFGASCANLGSGLKFDSERFPLPRITRAGFGLFDEFRGNPIVIGLESKFMKNQKTGIAAGAEIEVLKIIALRGGFSFKRNDATGIRFGFGVKLSKTTLEYAWSGFGDLGNSQRVGLKFNFDGWRSIDPKNHTLLE